MQLSAVGDSSLCVDSMEMEPWTDDLMPMPVSVDGGCSVPETPITTRFIPVLESRFIKPCTWML